MGETYRVRAIELYKRMNEEIIDSDYCGLPSVTDVADSLHGSDINFKEVYEELKDKLISVRLDCIEDYCNYLTSIMVRYKYLRDFYIDSLKGIELFTIILKRIQVYDNESYKELDLENSIKYLESTCVKNVKRFLWHDWTDDFLELFNSECKSQFESILVKNDVDANKLLTYQKIRLEIIPISPFIIFKIESFFSCKTLSSTLIILSSLTTISSFKL